MAEFIITEVPKGGTTGGKIVGVFPTRAEAEAFLQSKTAEGNESVWYQLSHRDRPAGLAGILRSR
jgi:hypothetical protein